MDKLLSDELLIVPMFVGVETEERYEPLRGGEEIGKRKVQAVATRLSDLAAGLKEFLSHLEILFKDSPGVQGDFTLNEIEISVGVTAEGKFILFGIGAEGGAEGGLRFLLKRTSPRE